MNLRLKRPLISTLPILLFALILPLFAQENGGGSAVPLSPAAYKIGERLTYNISFSNFPSVGHVELQVVTRGTFFGRDAIQLKAHAQTTGVVNAALYSINNDYTTYVDPDSGLPFRSEEIIRDAIKSTDSVQDLNQTAGSDAIQKTFPGTYDVLSAFYRARALPLTEGGVYSFVVKGESTDYRAELKVTGHQVIRTNVGSFSTIVTQVKIDNSPLRNLKVYFSDDDQHVPVLLTGKVSTGQLTAELAGSEFIKPPPGAATPTPPIATATPRPTPRPTITPLPTEVLNDLPFAVGEQLNYQVFVGGNTTPMGLATFQVRGLDRYFDRPGLFLTVKAQTTGAAARVFVANDQIESYVDPKGMLPYRSVLNLVEGKRRLNHTLTFNQETGSVVSDKGTRIDIPIGTHDYLSFFYAVRTFNLSASKRNAISILVGNKPKTLFVTAEKRESIQLGDQKIVAIPLTLTTDDPQSDKFRLRLWISDDRRRLPLRITGATEIGPIRADLVILTTASQ